LKSQIHQNNIKMFSSYLIHNTMRLPGLLSVYCHTCTNFINMGYLKGNTHRAFTR